MRMSVGVMAAAVVRLMCCCITHFVEGNGQVETKFSPVQKNGLKISTTAQTSSTWIDILKQDDYRILSLDDSPIIDVRHSTSISPSSSSSSDDDAQSADITPIETSRSTRQRQRQRQLSDPVDGCVARRIFVIPIGNYSDEHTVTAAADDDDIGVLLRIIVHRSTSFALDGNFRVYRQSSESDETKRSGRTKTSDWRRMDATKPDSIIAASSSPSAAPAASAALGCFYTGHVIGMTSSSWVVVSVHDDEVMMAIQLNDETTYIVEPVPNEITIRPTSTSGPYHVIYKEVTVETAPVDDLSGGGGGKMRRARRAASDNYMGRTEEQQHGGSQPGVQLEVLVVVDKEMFRRHRANDVTTYTLAIMNMVASLVSDNSIGHKINISLMALILLENDEPRLNISHHAGESLMRFCHWQASLRHVQHDLAILITGMDICSYKDAPCDTLGFAPIRGMCNPHESCLISEDTGLGTAFTIAHEIGHSFGMLHDGVNNPCAPASGSIMSPTLVGHQGTFKWSSCSRKYLGEFLRTPQSWCVVGLPTSHDQPVLRSIGMSLTLPYDKLPGELYSANVQCRWQFGPSSSTCSFDFAKDVCKTLWCHTGGRKCETKHLPAAEGTSCGIKRWCRKGTCVLHGNTGPSPIHGGWSEFGTWSQCSRTCGGGIAYKERQCNAPRAQYGGKECEGEMRLYKLCNPEACSVDNDGFREEQCRAYNDKEFRGQLYDWLPYTNFTDASDRCRLYCQPVGHRFYFALANKVVDGTQCGISIYDVCIDGVCVSVGCDGLLNSGLHADKCGVCGGDNLTCVTTVRPTSVPRRKTSSSNDVIVSRHSTNTTAAYRWSYGDWRPCSKPCDRGWQKRLVSCVNVETGRRTSARHCSHLPRTPVKRRRCNDQPCPAEWYAGSWSRCSVTCGHGSRHRVVTCRDVTTNATVSDSVCVQRNLTRPNVTAVCKAKAPTCYVDRRWMLSAWSSCSQSCGRGSRHRSAICSGQLSDGRWKVLQNAECHDVRRYPDGGLLEELCQLPACPSTSHDSIQHARWFTSAWKQCSATCGVGSIQERLVRCLDDTTGLPSERCYAGEKPAEIQSCSLQPCPIAVTSNGHASTPTCHDSLNWCRHLVTAPRLCTYRYYAKQCCRTCLNRSRGR